MTEKNVRLQINSLNQEWNKLVYINWISFNSEVLDLSWFTLTLETLLLKFNFGVETIFILFPNK